MSERVSTLKQALKSVVLSVPGAGYVDLERPDADATPAARVKHGAVTTPYWDLRVGRFREQPATFGGGASVRQVFRWYPVRLEGWQGFSGASVDTDDWDVLVERIHNALRTCSPSLGPLLGGFMDLESLQPDAVDIVALEGKARAHHALITCEARFFLTVGS